MANVPKITKVDEWKTKIKVRKGKKAKESIIRLIIEKKIAKKAIRLWKFI